MLRDIELWLTYVHAPHVGTYPHAHIVRVPAHAGDSVRIVGRASTPRAVEPGPLLLARDARVRSWVNRVV